MRTLTLATLTLLATCLVTTRVDAQDVDAMARWTSYKLVHYHVVGEYAGETKILLGTQGLYRVAPVKDRVEIDFDWNQQEMKLTGTPVIKNFATTTGALLPVEGCPAARVEGTYEMATVTSVTDMGGTMLALTSTRAYPAGSIPLPGDMDACGTTWDTVAKSSLAAEGTLIVPPAMMLVMPGVTTTADGKSMVVKGGNTGVNASGLNDWSWTFTPVPVK